MRRNSPKRGVAHVDRRSWRRSIGTVTSGRAAVASSSSCSAASSDRPSAIVSPNPRFVQKNKNRDVGSRRKPLGRRGAPAAGAGRSAHADARRVPRARVRAASMANAANFRSDFSSASRESASEAEFAEPVVAHGDPVAGGARSAPSPAAAPRSPHHHPARPRRAIARAPSSAPIRDSYKRTKIATSAAGASRSVAAALRRLVRVGPVTPMRAASLARA